MKSFGACTLGSYSFLTGAAGSLQLSRVVKRIRLGGYKNIVLDLETTGLDQILDDILLCAFTFDGVHAYVVDTKTVDISPFINLLKEVQVANHNIGFDYGFLKYKYGLDLPVVWDTLLTYSLATTGLPGKTKEHKDSGASLQAIALKYLGVLLDKSVRKQFLTDTPITDESISYAGDDVLAAWALVPITASLLNASGLRHVWELVERDFIRVIVEMHLNGIDFDMDKALSLRDQYQERVAALSVELDEMTKYEDDVPVKCKLCRNGTKYKKDGGGSCEVCGGQGFTVQRIMQHVNFSSSRQVIEWLKRNGVEVPTKLREDGSEMETVDAKARESINHPVIAKLNEYLVDERVLSGFLTRLTTPTNIDREGHFNHITGKVHPKFTQLYTNTGRLSSYEPNIQNQKRDNDLRSIFSAPKGEVMIIADYSQYEVRVMAEVSGDEGLSDFFIRRSKLVDQLQGMLDAIDEVTYTPEIGDRYSDIRDVYTQVNNLDFHNETAIALFHLKRDKIDFESKQWKQMRSVAKNVSFAIPYGAGPPRVAATSGVSEKEAKIRINKYFELYPKVQVWLENIKKQAIRPDVTGTAKKMGLGNSIISWTSTILGRRRFFLLPEDVSAKKELGSIQREGCNFPIQGVNADVIKLVLNNVSKQIREDEGMAGSVIRMTIHDEIVVSCPIANHKYVARTVVNIMKSVSQQFIKSLPTEVGLSISPCWLK